MSFGLMKARWIGWDRPVATVRTARAGSTRLGVGVCAPAGTAAARASASVAPRNGSNANRVMSSSGRAPRA